MAGGSVIGVDLGGTKLLAARVGDDGRPGARVRRRVAQLGVEDLLDCVAEAVVSLGAGGPDGATAVGFGIPAVVDPRTGHSVRSNHLPLDGVPFGPIMRDRLGVPVAVDNDGNCAVLAEWRSGAAAGARDVVMVALGTGVAGGLVLDGRIYRGSAGAGAELGHMVVDLDGPECFGDCPGRGCLEAVASGSALGRDAAAAAREHPGSALAQAADPSGRVAGEDVTRLAQEGDPLARELVRRMGERLGAGLAGLAMAFGPEVIVVGGGAAAAGELLLEPARDELRRRAFGPVRDRVRVAPAALGDDAGMLGAAMLARETAS